MRINQVQRRRGASFSEALFWGGYEYYQGKWIKDGETYRVAITSVKTKPSDPYCSEREEREVAATFTAHESAAAPHEIDEGGMMLVLSDLEGVSVRFKELQLEKHASLAKGAAAFSEALGLGLGVNVDGSH